MGPAGAPESILSLDDIRRIARCRGAAFSAYRRNIHTITTGVAPPRVRGAGGDGSGRIVPAGAHSHAADSADGASRRIHLCARRLAGTWDSNSLGRSGLLLS